MGPNSMQGRRRLRPVTEGNIFFLVTIKKNIVDYTPISEIAEVYRSIREKLRNAEWSQECYELDSLNRIHLHIMLKVGKKPYYKAWQKKGYTIHFQEVKEGDEQRVYDYIHKSSQHKAYLDIINAESYYTYHDSFITCPRGLERIATSDERKRGTTALEC